MFCCETSKDTPALSDGFTLCAGVGCSVIWWRTVVAGGWCDVGCEMDDKT